MHLKDTVNTVLVIATFLWLKFSTRAILNFFRFWLCGLLLSGNLVERVASQTRCQEKSFEKYTSSSMDLYFLNIKEVNPNLFLIFLWFNPVTLAIRG